MSTLRVYLGVVGLNDVGYRFYTQNAPEAARQTDNIVDEGDGWYSVAGVTLLGDHVRWDSTGTPEAVGRESLMERILLELIAAKTAELPDDFPSLDDMVDAVLDEPAGDHVAAGTIGEAINQAAANIMAGSGAFTVTVTVTDESAAPLQNVIVRLKEGLNTFTATTDSSGLATFALDAAAYTVTLSKVGYAFTPSSLNVTGDGNFDLEMSQVAIPIPSDPALSVGSLITYDDSGVAISGVPIWFQLRDTLPGNGRSYRNAPFRLVSADLDDSPGVLFHNFPRGASYRAMRSVLEPTFESPDKWVGFDVPDADSFELPLVLGSG